MVHLAVLRREPWSEHNMPFANTLHGPVWVPLWSAFVIPIHSIYRNEDADLEMTGARSEDPLVPQYEDPDSLSRKPPPAVTNKKEEAVDIQTNPSVS